MNKNQQIVDDIKDAAVNIMRGLSLFADLSEEGWEKSSELQDATNQLLAGVQEFEKNYLTGRHYEKRKDQPDSIYQGNLGRQ